MWGSDYQISIVIKSLATVWRMSDMEQDGGSKRRERKDARYILEL